MKDNEFHDHEQRENIIILSINRAVFTALGKAIHLGPDQHTHGNKNVKGQ